MNKDNNDRIYFCDMKDLKKRKGIKAYATEKLNNAVRFFNDNKEFVLFVGVPTVLGLFGVAKTGIRAISRNTSIRMEQHRKDTRLYDPSLRCYWKLSHKLSNDERRMIAVRRKNGERYSDILHDMKLI